ncbi:2-dehydro-3-deoxygalactonokinase [Ketogulonicigenium robustum]|uniref:2-dehydro-3-deoxygalactonokinase n=1 Tax=Ketogulonicigenium robustum TaxID=92947 RepID=A0A1W6NXQ1_9RHOB|nr:2-dehydro-3-deoxygalactonokinase [Ketogulonicigenium robustum]ARO14025.1 2-dehydro-3-deoxygalactonokinase [Ketogulonicigenium robustum]
MTGAWIALDGLTRRGWKMQGASVTGTFALDAGLPDGVPVVACGLSGPLPRALPAKPLDGLALQNNWALVPGLVQQDTGATTLGEEARIAGWLRAAGDWDGAICICHDRTLWAHVSAGEVVGLRASLTGRIADLLDEGQAPADIDMVAFDTAVQDGYARPEQLLARLEGAASVSATHGLLIGADLAGAKRWWLGQDIVVIGPRADIYARALQGLGAAPRTAPDAETTLAGLIAAAARKG